MNVWRFIRRWWWAFLAAIAAILGVIASIFFRSTRYSDVAHDPSEEKPRQSFKERAEKEVELVKLEGEIEKARVEAIADVMNQELDNIETLGKENPVEARRQLALWLQTHL
jgi:hypothetical protein